MKYYIYISDTKVDMLYPQIPKPLLKKIASSLSIDLKVLGAEVNIGAKSNPSDETRYSKVRIVSEYVEKNLDVGNIDTPSTYFKGSLSMQWTPTESVKGLVLFGGATQHTLFELAGSAKHIIGSREDSNVYCSGLPYLLAALSQDEKNLYPNGPDIHLVEDINSWALASIAKNLNEISHLPKQHLEFLAKTLLQGPRTWFSTTLPMYKNQRYVVLGTPIYVAIDD